MHVAPMTVPQSQQAPRPSGRQEGPRARDPGGEHAVPTKQQAASLPSPAPSSRQQLRRAALALGLPLVSLALMVMPVVAQQAADGGGAAAPQASSMEPPASGAEGLKQASAARRAAYKLEDAAREVGLMDAAAAYGRVADQVAWAAAERAEGAFRAGEILRSLKHEIEARERFAQAVTFGDDESAAGFAARGLLEQGHLHRRHDNVEGAVEFYDAVRTRFVGQRRTSAHALTWSGKLLLANDGRVEGRRRLLSFGEEFPEYPAEAVRNADIVAVGCHAAGELAMARQVASDVRLRMQPLLDAGDKRAAGIRRALDRMKIAKLLGDGKSLGEVADLPDESEEQT